MNIQQYACAEKQMKTLLYPTDATNHAANEKVGRISRYAAGRQPEVTANHKCLFFSEVGRDAWGHLRTALSHGKLL